ncbi:Serine/arginine repetitive matrix protein 1 [Sesamum angolense]|uniref:Serine/arginine repetitive matrix protein 1 n=1 Tax=Sesamum angolense TaxID=2727404 RepID=A0AAE2C3H3_9LAMI|nr:Serine/arginine repetitive matrix protein 1 [Sesamum angolense]
MSGGFFRGTSADQDTRFSNKQAKLLKSQKFAPELENLVDMTKVKMDVMRPWIAKRVTELIGFEDEVLINFIYSLLEGKEVNGKQVHISLTGFMERNTGKFMKELWALLLSAQQNAETDRIANEIHRKKEKEKQEIEQEKIKMDGDGAMPRDKHDELDLHVKNDAGGSGINPADDKERYKRNGRRRPNRGSQSPDSAYRSPSLRKKRSISPSKSNSGSYSDGRRRSSSTSGTLSRSRSISSERRRRSSPRRSVTPRRRHITRRSPSPWRRSLHSKRRSTSHARSRSPSPVRYRVRSPRHHRSRSPLRRRSRSPVRRRSRTPIRRSPMRYRSRTPLRRRSPSPVRRRSLSPMQGRSLSPMRRRSPFVRRRSPSPLRRRSPSPVRRSPSPARRRYHRSPSIPHQQSISPVRRRSSLHGRKRSFTPVRRRSPSPQESSSPSHVRRSSLSPVRRGSPRSARSPVQSSGERARRHEKYAPARRASPSEESESPSENCKETRLVEGRPMVSLRSPQRDMLDQNNLRRKERDFSPSTQRSPFLSDASRGRSYGEERRSTSPRGSSHQKRERMVPESPNPLRKAAGQKPHHDSSGTGADDENKFSSRETGDHKYRSSRKISPVPVRHRDSTESAGIPCLVDGTKEDPTSGQVAAAAMFFILVYWCSETDLICYEGKGAPKLSRKSEQNDRNGSLDSPSKETDEQTVKVKEKRKHKKSDRQEVESDDYSSYDSYEERKEAKRRRKEEKKLKKEERRRRREERRRRRDERRAEKLKLRSMMRVVHHQILGEIILKMKVFEGETHEQATLRRQSLSRRSLRLNFVRRLLSRFEPKRALAIELLMLSNI